MGALKSAGEILESVVEDGQEELQRATPGLAFSGLAAGLNISFGAVALAGVAALTGGVGLAAMLFYPVGFLIVILGQSQLFTENTITPVTVVMERINNLTNLMRLWVVVFLANFVGVLAFGAAVVYGDMLQPTMMDIMFEEAIGKLDYGFVSTLFKAILGGWIVALMAWLVAASRDTISQVFFVYVLAFLIPATGLTHCIAGSAEFTISVFAGEIPFLEFLGGFLLPTTIGNIIGGVILVTLLNYGQVAGSKKTAPGAGNTYQGQQGEDS